MVAKGPYAFLTHTQGGNQRKAWADEKDGIGTVLKGHRLFANVVWPQKTDWYQSLINHVRHLFDTQRHLYAPTSSRQEQDDTTPEELEFTELLKQAVAKSQRGVEDGGGAQAKARGRVFEA